MVIEKSCKCVKLKLPNDKVVDVLSPVLKEMYQWIQDSNEKPESGGYIVGYQHKETEQSRRPSGLRKTMS